MPRPPSISPELMTTFVAVVRMEGDATKAAEFLHINQPSMSKRLAFLQHAGRILRRPWLERIGKTWKLTDEGRRVLPAVEELIHRYRLLTESIEEERPAAVFGCDNNLATGFVREATRLFRSRHPEIAFRISSLEAKARVEGVANGFLDLACLRMPVEEIHDLARRALYIDDLYDDPLVLAAVPTVNGFAEFQAITDRSITPKSLTRFPLIVPEAESGIRRDFDRRCRDAGVLDRLNVVAEVGPWSTTLAFVRDGVGVGMIARSATTGQTGLTIRPLPAKFAPVNTIRVICRKQVGSDELDLTAGAAQFLKALRDSAKAIG